jgi:ribA/ribD-fused uncharacterized protein
MNYNINWLLTKIENGFIPEYVFFWGHKQKQEGIIDKYCFSQWYPAAFVVDGIKYPTAEHWMMAKKALLFKDAEQYENILLTDSPAKAKKSGRLVKNFDDKIWKANADDFVVEGNKHKFSQHNDMKEFLLNTNNSIIVEASPFDKIWGIGTKTHETNPFKWKGTNLLGFALMQVRDVLKHGK